MQTKEFHDHRGSHTKFWELKNAPEEFNQVTEIFATTNNSQTLRGLHFQKGPTQRKIIRAMSGWFNVRVVVPNDVEYTPSNEFYKDVKENYTVYYFDGYSPEHHPIYVPEGAFLGYVSLEDYSTMLYIADAEFNPEGCLGVNPFTSKLNINWGGETMSHLENEDLILSDRDRNLTDEYL